MIKRAHKDDHQFDEDACPCPCEVCGGWFDLEDGLTHPRKDRLIICEGCAHDIEQEIEKEEEIDELLSQISDAEDTIKCSKERLDELGYKNLTKNYMNFGQAIESLKEGKLVAREGWNGKGMFVVKQIPALIGLDIIPKMQSLPDAAKSHLIEKQQPIHYTNQMLIVNAEGRADSWVPSSSDCFAEDWIIVN